MVELEGGAEAGQADPHDIDAAADGQKLEGEGEGGHQDLEAERAGDEPDEGGGIGADDAGEDARRPAAQACADEEQIGGSGRDRHKGHGDEKGGVAGGIDGVAHGCVGWHAIAIRANSFIICSDYEFLVLAYLDSQLLTFQRCNMTDDKFDLEDIEVPIGKDMVPHIHNGQTIHQRATDGYINATAMCKATGKEWSSYRRNEGTEGFLEALERSLQIRRDLLIITASAGPNEQRGTWVHPQIAINLATWLSPEFAVQVSEWVVTWMMGIAKRRSVYPDFNNLNEDEKRLYLRDNVTSANKKLAEAAHGSGVSTPEDFGIFQSFGYRGMYAGRSVKEIREVKGLPQKAQILDHMGSAELAANLFRITQTEEKLINENIRGKHLANTAHYEVGRMVREAMSKMSGVYPENLPVAPDVKKLQKKINKENYTLGFDKITQIESEGSKESDPIIEINLKSDLWKYALLVMATAKDGTTTTTNLLSELPKYIQPPEDSQEPLTGRRDTKFSQIVRNLKSHKNAKTNFIFQGYAEDVPGGFAITEKGRAFVRDYFKGRESK